MSILQGLLNRFGLGASYGRPALRVFLLDDDTLRHEWFAKQFRGEGLDVAESAARAVELLSANHYDLIFLDHDLLPEHYKNQQEADDERTGYAVASWLAAHAGRHSVANIIVHTRNADGAWRMVSLMRDAGLTAEHVPFPYLSQKIKTYWRR